MHFFIGRKQVFVNKRRNLTIHFLDFNLVPI